MSVDRNNALEAIHATVVWAVSGGWPREVAVQLPPGSTAADAVRAAAFVAGDVQTLDMGVFNKVQKPTTLLRDGDRVEIYQPLWVDPKEARRIRAQVRRRRSAKK